MWPGSHEVLIEMHHKAYENGSDGRHSAIMYYEIIYENECRVDIDATNANFDAFIAIANYNFIVEMDQAIQYDFTLKTLI